MLCLKATEALATAECLRLRFQGIPLFSYVYWEESGYFIVSF
ncbi:hypothetical protein HMPREF9999_00091 [Alloprevotella sp. oral taxon 473 str. F0040]|nr:hypothetical protein HMPREF9999_00091 [Alloprevotella sp. oral taxon 473 str. F0040]